MTTFLPGDRVRLTGEGWKILGLHGFVETIGRDDGFVISNQVYYGDAEGRFAAERVAPAKPPTPPPPSHPPINVVREVGGGTREVR